MLSIEELTEGQNTETDVVKVPSGKPNDQAEITFPKAVEMFKSFVKDNKTRNDKNTAIQKKRDGQQPYNPRKLKAAGQSWRSNRPTGFLKSLLKRLLPPFKQMLEQLPLLTYSSFPNERLGSEAMQDKFRKHITDTLRDDPSNSDLNDRIIDEDMTFGYCGVTCLDEYDFRPKMRRGDEIFFPVNSPQEVEKIQAFGVREDIPIHDAMNILKNVETSREAGWQIENLIKKTNDAPDQFKLEVTDGNERVYEDLIASNNLSATFTSSIKVIKTGQILAKSPTGGISHYIFDRDDGTPIYFKRDKFAKMADCLVVFSAEVADGTLQGSKGAGHALYNTHVSVDQARNLVQDGFHLSGLLVLKRERAAAGQGRSQSQALTVNHPFAIIGEEYVPLKDAQFNVDTDAFIALDQHAQAQAEVQLGIFMPGSILDQTGEKRTASEVNYTASIDAQIRAGVMARFASQYFKLVDLQQSRICHPEVLQIAKAVFAKIGNGETLTPIYDKELWQKLLDTDSTEGFAEINLPPYITQAAVECCLKMLQDDLSPKQIILLANSTSRAKVDDAIASQSGVLDLIVARYIMDPMIDTVELKRRDLTSKIGADAAERLMAVELNPLSDVQQQRLQLTELATMLSGNPCPVDQTDNHKLHLDVIASRIQPMLKNPSVNPLASSQEFLMFLIEHGKAHIEMAINQGQNPADFAESQAAIESLEQIVAQPPLDAAVNLALEEGATPGAVLASETTLPPIIEEPALNAGDLVTAPQSEVVPSNPNSPTSTIQGMANPARPTPPRGI